MNQVVTRGDFIFDTAAQQAAKYVSMTEHEMLPEIELCRRISYRLLGLRLGFYKRTNLVAE